MEQEEEEEVGEEQQGVVERREGGGQRERKRSSQEENNAARNRRRRFGCFRFMELAEIGRCRASVSPPQTHQGGLLGRQHWHGSCSLLFVGDYFLWGCPRRSNARAAGSAGAAQEGGGSGAKLK